MMWENIKMAGRSIVGNKLRTFLTMLGIIIGVGAVVSINSIGQGVQQLLTKQVAGLGSNVVVILPGKVQGGGSPGSAGIGASTLISKDVTDAHNNRYASAAAPLAIIGGLVANGNKIDSASTVVATTSEYTAAYPSQKISQGTFFTSSQINDDVVALSAASRDTLFGKDAQVVGKTVTIRTKPYTIVGVFKAPDSGSSGLGAAESLVIIPNGSAKTLIGSEPQISRIITQAKSQEEVQPLADSLTKSIKKNHHNQDDFSVLTQKDILATFNTILGALTAGISAIAGISLLVGGIGIMNIMLVSVTERTREIGLRKALGATSGMVLSQFLIEAVVVTILGGAIGIALAYGASVLIAKFVSFTPVVSAETVAIAFGVSALVGIIFGIAPAIKAARMKPIDALRHE